MKAPAPAQEDDEGGEEIERLDSALFVPIYGTNRLVTYELDIADQGWRYQDRFHAARSLIADFVNEAATKGRAAFARHTFDIWLGQRIIFGHYVPRMLVTIAGVTDLPPKRLLTLFSSRAGEVAPGRSPLGDGLNPELRVEAGTVSGVWWLTFDQLLKCSQAYQYVHSLADKARDPYLQRAAGASEPAHFIWHEREPDLPDRAVELVGRLTPESVFIPKNREELIGLGLTFDGLQECGSSEDLDESHAVVEASLNGGEGPAYPPTIKELRTWLYIEAARTLGTGDKPDLARVERVVLALREELTQWKHGPPLHRYLKSSAAAKQPKPS